MKSIKLSRTASPAAGVRNQTQLSAVAWIIAAWCVGTLISALSVVGAEPIGAASQHAPFLMRQWEQQEKEFALFHGGALFLSQSGERDRPSQDEIPNTISKASTKHVASRSSVPARAEDRPADDADQVEENAAANTTTIASMIAAHRDSRAEPIASTTSARVANWLTEQSSNEQSRDATVDLVVHDFDELMTPVHVGAAGQDTPFIKLTDHAGAKGSISLVDRDPQHRLDSADTPMITVDSTDLEPSDTASIVSVQGDRAAEEVETAASAEGASILRSSPQLLAVPEHSILKGPTNAEWQELSDHEPAQATDVQVRAENTTEPATTVASPATAVATSTPARLPMPAPAPEPATGAEKDASAAGQLEERLAASWPFEKSKSEGVSGVSLNVENADVRTVFEMLARGYKMNILVAPDVNGTVTANVEGLSPETTLQGIVKMCGLSMQRDDELIYIYSADKVPADARQLRVFPLDFARASSLEPTVQGLLSPVGNAYPSTLSDQDTMQTQESIVVVDIPEVIAQVDNFINQADRAPRQVMIEARVLEVELSDDMLHGVDFEAIFRGDLKVGGLGFADPLATINTNKPRFFARIPGSDIDALVTLLETTTDSKTLASPRVQVINGQNARIQVGQQLGFTVATVTQTSTIQDVQFLETGVVLNVTPTISRDNRILMQVKPEVSDGEINPDTLLPEEQTREVETSVLLDNHEGVIIGGLIQEKDRTVIKKLPWLGDVRHVGKFFQRREAVRSRSEIIVALIPHIVEPDVQDERNLIDYDRVQTPLLQGRLQRTCRPWEPRLPDPAGEPHHLDVERVNRMLP